MRDLIVFGVLTDMMQGRPAVYATFSSYDEVAHHSGLERADTLEALRKLDQHFARIERARRFAPRPYKLVVLSDHGQTQGATFKQRNGYDLSRARASGRSSTGRWRTVGGDENDAAVGHAVNEATGTATRRAATTLSDRHVVALGSGNLGLIYLMEERRRLTLEEIERPPPAAASPRCASIPTSASCWCAPSETDRSCSAPRRHYLDEGRVEGEDPLAPFSANAPRAPAPYRPSSTSPTSWSTASTTPSSSRAARSRS